MDEIKQTILGEGLLEDVFPTEDKEYLRINHIGKPITSSYVSNLPNYSNIDSSDTR